MSDQTMKQSNRLRLNQASHNRQFTSKLQLAVVLCYSSILFGVCNAQEDILNGAGAFNDPSYTLEDWVQVAPSYYTSLGLVTNSDDETYLEMEKSATASGFFDDGLAYLFKDADGEAVKGFQPYHIHIEVQTGTQALESCDFRLYSVEHTGETMDEMTHETVCANDMDATGGPNIEAEGANPTHESGSPPREDEDDFTGSPDDDGTEDTTDDTTGTTDETGETDTTMNDDADADNDMTDDSETDMDESAENPECSHGSTVITKSPDGFGAYAKVKHSDVIFMRLGYFNYLKMNTESMIKEFFEGEWMSIDMLIDWDDQTVSIYADGEAQMAVPFFTKRAEKLSDVNTLALYGLSPESVSRFRNLKVCTEICSDVGVNPYDLTIIDGALFTLGSGLQLMTLLGAVFFALSA